jgi:hypothetical protein
VYFREISTSSSKENADLADRLPLDPESDELFFHAASDGLVLIKLINSIEPDRIDIRTVNRG